MIKTASFFISLAFVFLPGVVLADSTFSSITTSADSLTAGATTTHTVTFTTTTATSSGKFIVFKYYEADNGAAHSGFDFSGATFTAGTGLNATFSLLPDSQSSMQLALTSALSAATYSFTITNIVNTTKNGNYKPGLTVLSTDGAPTPVFGSTFTIAGGSDSNDDSDSGTNIVTAVTVTPASTVTGALTSYEISLTTELDMASGLSFNIAFLDSAKAPVAFLTDSSTFSSSDVVGTLKNESKTATGKIELSSALAAGDHILNISNIMNPALGGDNTYTFVISSLPITQTGYVESDSFLITDAIDSISDDATLTAPTKLRVKRNKESSVVLKWNSVDDATKYTVRLLHKNGKKIAKWKNITTTKKVVPKKFIKAGRKAYKFRVRACNNTECSDWSAFKKFKVKLP